MLENGIKILSELMPAFADKDAEEFRSQLTVYGVLSKSEDKLVNSKILDADKFTEIFSMLKPKQEDLVFPALQKICMKLKWRTMLHLIQSKLEYENTEKFIVPDLELQKIHEIFKYAIPTMHMLFVGRVGYLTAIHDLIEKCKVVEQNDISKLVKIAVTGLGGVGKTQLVMRFLAKYQLEYDSVIWINAESFTTTTTSFTELGKQLGTYNEKMSIRSNVEAIYRKLGHLYVRNVVIFDNADDFIPSEFWFDQLANFVLIITSRNRLWPYFETKVDIDVFQPKEAIEFVKKSLSEESYDSNGDVDSLIKELQYFPLALQQAVAYITQSHEDEKILSSRFTINDYLEEYLTERKRLLDFQILTENNEVNYATTLNTWTVTVAKLTRLLYPGTSDAKAFQATLPIQILNLISFIDGEQIDPSYFMAIANIDKRYLGWSIRKLDQYSMISKVSLEEHREKNLISVHKLVQEITRIRLQDENLATKPFDICCCIMISCFPKENSLEDLANYKMLLPHFASLKHIMATSPYNTINLQVQYRLLGLLQVFCMRLGHRTLLRNCLLHLLLMEHKLYGYGTQPIAKTVFAIGREFFEFGHLKMANIFFKRSLAINSHCQCDTILREDLIICLSSTYLLLGNLTKSLQLREKLFIIKQSHTDPETISNYQSLKVAYVNGLLGDIATQKRILENTLEIREKRFGPEHPEVSPILTQLAKVYRNERNYEQALALYQRALKIEENCQGTEDYTVATILLGIADIKGRLGDSETQTIVLERALKIFESTCGLNSPQVVPVLEALVVAHGELGDPLQKKDLLERVLTIKKKHYGAKNIKVAGTLVELSNVYNELGNSTKAEMHLSDALYIMENATVTNDLDDKMQKLGLEKELELQRKYDIIALVPTLENLYKANMKSRNFSDAKKFLKWVLKIQEKFYEKGNFKTERTRLLLEQIDEGAVTPDTLNNYLALLKRQYPANHPEVLQCIKRLADLYATKGDFLQSGMQLFEYYLLQYPTKSKLLELKFI